MTDLGVPSDSPFEGAGQEILNGTRAPEPDLVHATPGIYSAWITNLATAERGAARTGAIPQDQRLSLHAASDGLHFIDVTPVLKLLDVAGAPAQDLACDVVKC